MSGGRRGRSALEEARIVEDEGIFIDEGSHLRHVGAGGTQRRVVM